jgi:hypothetical protein
MSLSPDIGWRRVVPLVAAVCALCCVAPASRAGGESRLRVDYEAGRLSVEAREVSLVTLLREIGEKVGFTVVEAAPSSAIVTLSIKDASLDDVLRQLLRAENHTVLYRAASVGMPEPGVFIDTVVLLGRPGDATPTLARGEQAQVQDRPAPTWGDPAFPRGITSPSPAQPSLGAAPLISRGGALPPATTGDPGVPPITVGDLLKAHAMGAVPPASATGLDAGPAPDSSTPPLSLDATLAETTRRAQQALGALVEGLAKATESLRQSSAGQK